MANLLSRTAKSDPFPAFDPVRRARFEERARLLFGLRFDERGREFDLLADRFESELEELEDVPSIELAEDLLDRIDRRRRTLLEEKEANSSASGDGAWLCYWPGRSLGTGESEIASRGFFDGMDRPPLGLWVEAIGRRDPSRPGKIELAVLCWIPAAELDRARAGRRACAARTLAFLEEVSDDLSQQVDAIQSAGRA